jgi:hypothetical protein
MRMLRSHHHHRPAGCVPSWLTTPRRHLPPPQVVEARIVYDRDSGQAAGYAYVSYATKAEAGGWGGTAGGSSCSTVEMAGNGLCMPAGSWRVGADARAPWQASGRLHDWMHPDRKHAPFDPLPLKETPPLPPPPPPRQTWPSPPLTARSSSSPPPPSASTTPSASRTAPPPARARAPRATPSSTSRASRPASRARPSSSSSRSTAACATCRCTPTIWAPSAAGQSPCSPATRR